MSHSFTVQSGFGAAIKLSTTALAGLLTLEGPELERGTVETTNMATTGAKTYRYEILYDGGTVSGTAEFDPQETTHQAWLALLTGGTSGSFLVVFPDTTTYGFTGLLTKFSPGGMEEDENLSFDFEIKVSGEITVTLPS
jgi:hypothetical protein